MAPQPVRWEKNKSQPRVMASLAGQRHLAVLASRKQCVANDLRRFTFPPRQGQQHISPGQSVAASAAQRRPGVEIQ